MSPARDFWSRRKAAVQAEQEAMQNVEALEAVERLSEVERPSEDERSDAEILAELDLPDPDELQPGDDIAGFMARAVPDRLRRRALRQLWKLNPMLANLDGLIDYGEDFTDTGAAGEVIATAYQVGKGMLAHVEEMARQAAAESAPAENPLPAAEVAETAPDETAPIETALAPDDTDRSAEPTQAPPDEPVSAAWPAMAEAPQPDPVSPESAPAPRRMRFAFEG